MNPDRRRRGQSRPSKGDLRELAILDAAERRLALDGFETLTMETIASDVGISRASLYFYFGSKQEVLTALVARTMQSLAAEASSATGPTTGERAEGGAETIRAAIDVTADAWRLHGTVMRAAVELGPMVPEIGRLWEETVARFVRTMTSVARSSQIGPGPTSVSAEEHAYALCWMTERVLYRACVEGADLKHAAEVCHRVWMSALRVTD